MFTRFFASSFLTLFSFQALIAQAASEPVSSPQRGTTYTDETGMWYEQPFVWIGLIIIILLVILLMIRRKNAPVRNRLHKY